MKKKSLNKFRCYSCGWCCRIEKYSSQEEFDLAKKALEKLGIKLHGIKMPINNMILWDKPCQALKIANNKATCLIYDQRPYPCRQFLCGKQSEQDTRPFIDDTHYNMNYFRELLKNPDYAKIKEELEDKAVLWGNKYNWNLKKIK